MTAMSPLADTEGFVVAYPAGLGFPANWNAGGCCGSTFEVDRDDKGFIRAVVEDIGARTCIDTARTYIMGFSNGGMMTVRLACEMSDTFAAAATVSGSAVIPLEGCVPSKPIALMHIHGTADALVPYDGGPGALPLLGRPTPVFPAASAEVARLRSGDGCAATVGPYRETSDTHCDVAGPCGANSEVVLCTVDGGAHAWPTPSGRTGTGTWNETSSFDATTEIWAFMKRHARR
jgi:polyhydroxybutyrate depolymerase